MSVPSPQPPSAPRTWLERLAQVILAVAALWALAQVGARVAPVLSPVLASLLLAYLLDPVVDRFEARGVSRSLAIALLGAFGIAAIGLFVSILAPVLIEQISEALRILPGWATQEYEHLSRFALERYGVDVADQLRDAAGFLSERAQAALASLVQVTADSVATLLNVVLIPVFTFYFLRDFDTLKRWPLEVVPPRFRDGVVARARRMDGIVGEWLRGQVQVALVLAVLYAIGLSIAGVRLGAVIGIIAGLLNVVPYLGGLLGIALSALMALVYGENVLGELIGVAVVFSVVQGLEGYLITPRLVGEKVGMSPMTVMVVLLLGGSLFGFFGLMLSVPVVAAASVLLEDVVAMWRESEFYARSEDAGGSKDAADAGAGEHTPPSPDASPTTVAAAGEGHDASRPLDDADAEPTERPPASAAASPTPEPTAIPADDPVVPPAHAEASPDADDPEDRE